MSIDVFISYSTKDVIAAKAACAKLEAVKIRCWMAPRDIVPGAPWGASIVHAIDQCWVMVLIFSGNANGSAQVHREVDQAFSKGKAVVPLRIEEVRPAAELAYYLDTVHWLDALTAPLERNLESLVVAVKSLLAARDRAHDDEARDKLRDRDVWVDTGSSIEPLLPSETAREPAPPPLPPELQPLGNDSSNLTAELPPEATVPNGRTTARDEVLTEQLTDGPARPLHQSASAAREALATGLPPTASPPRYEPRPPSEQRPPPAPALPKKANGGKIALIGATIVVLIAGIVVYKSQSDTAQPISPASHSASQGTPPMSPTASDNIWIKRGDEASAKGDYQNAYLSYQMAFRANPLSGAYAKLVRIKQDHGGQLGDAISSSSPDIAKWRIQTGDQAMQRRDFGEALQSYEAAANEDPFSGAVERLEQLPFVTGPFPNYPVDSPLGLTLASGSGVVKVTAVAAGSVAATYGLKAGDVISQVDATSVSSPSDVVALINKDRSLNDFSAVFLVRPDRHLAVPLGGAS